MGRGASPSSTSLGHVASPFAAGSFEEAAELLNLRPERALSAAVHESIYEIGYAWGLSEAERLALTTLFARASVDWLVWFRNRDFTSRLGRGSVEGTREILTSLETKGYIRRWSRSRAGTYVALRPLRESRQRPDNWTPPRNPGRKPPPSEINSRREDVLRLFNERGRRETRSSGAVFEWITLEDIDAIFAAGSTCAICREPVEGREQIDLDHRKGLAEGGDHTRGNIQVTHRDCNRSPKRKSAGATKRMSPEAEIVFDKKKERGRSKKAA